MLKNRELQKYYREIRRGLQGNRIRKDETLKNVKDSLTVLMDEEPECTMEDVYAQIGTAEELCEAQREADGPEEQARANRRTRILGKVALVGCVFVTVLGIYCMKLIYEVQRLEPIYIRESVEILPENEMEDK